MTVLLLFCLCQYPALQDAVLAQRHHNPQALTYFTRQVLPGLFEDFLNGSKEVVTPEIFVRDARAEYIYTVGTTTQNAPGGDSR